VPVSVTIAPPRWHDTSSGGMQFYLDIGTQVKYKALFTKEINIKPYVGFVFILAI